MQKQHFLETFTNKQTKIDEATQIFTCDWRRKFAAGLLCVIIAAEFHHVGHADGNILSSNLKGRL